MSFCHECGEALVQGWAFCQGCGSALTNCEPVVVGVARGRTQPLVAGTSTDTLDTPDSATIEPEVASQPTPPEFDASEGDPVDVIEDMLGPAWTGELTVADASNEGEAPPISRRRSRRKLVLVGVGAIVILAIVAVTTTHILGTHDRLNRTRDVLATTESNLEETKEELGETRDTLTTTRSELTARTSERDAARSELNTTKAELTTTKAALGDARGKVDLQAAVIEDLRTCLDGVANALLYAADFYYSGALDELNRVEPACQRAGDAVV